MSAPEIPDFSAVPPSEQRPEGEQLSQTPRRSGRTLAVAGFATALVIGAVGTTAYLSDQRSGGDDVRLTAQTGPGAGGQPRLLGEDSASGSSASPTNPANPSTPGDPDGDGDRGRPGAGGHGGWGRGPGGHRGPGGLVGPRGALHGELVVPQQDGTGTRTIVVQSGTVTAVSAKSLSVKSTDGFTATYVIASSTRVAARSGGISSIKVGDTVSVAATKSGSTLTAIMVGARPDGARGRGTAPAPSPTTSSSAANGTSSTT